MTNELSAYNEGFRDGQAQGCTNEMHLVATHNLPLVEADLAAERIENTRLREAFVTMEQAANEREYERDALQRKLTTVLANYNEEAGRLMAERDGHRDDAAKLWADLAAARAMTRHWESRYALLESKWDAARAALKAKRGDAPRGGADTSVTVQMAGEDRHIPNLPALHCRESLHIRAAPIKLGIPLHRVWVPEANQLAADVLMEVSHQVEFDHQRSAP